MNAARLRGRRLTGRQSLFFLAVSLQLAAATSCHAQPAGGPDVGPAFAPAHVRTLRSFGSAGDGRRDDTAALTRAFKNSTSFCLDGEGATYRVVGTLEVSANFCLRNATLVQSLGPVDTASFVTRSCKVTENASAVIDCGDPRIPPPQLEQLAKALSVRTLLIRPPTGAAPIRVTLERVKIDRGPYAESGSRTDAAGIWLEGASRVDFRDVEIAGNGKGFGLLLIRSRNVRLIDLNIHDMVWAPYPGDARLTQARVSAIGWNSVPIHEFRSRGQDGVPTGKFYGVRVQEQISCLFLADVQHVEVENLRISRCMARFDGGDLPWQADGMDIGQSSSDISIRGAAIDSTWEGLDVVGTGRGVAQLSINNLAISNSFSYGLKMGYRLRDAKVTGLRIAGAGLGGVVVYGPARNILISEGDITGVGSVAGAKGNKFSPWPAGTRAGIRVDAGSGGTEAAGQKPGDVVISDVTVSKQAGSASYAFGLLNKGGTGVRTVRFKPSGFTDAAVRTDR